MLRKLSASFRQFSHYSHVSLCNAACRIICKLRDWRLGSIELVGNQPLPGVTYSHRFRNGGSKELPVLPSDHFGLLLKLEPV